MVEQRGKLRGVRDLLEAQDRPGQFAEGFLVNLEALGDGQDIRGGDVLWQKAEQTLKARAFPESDDLDEDLGPGRLVDDPVVGHPDPFAAQGDELGCPR